MTVCQETVSKSASTRKAVCIFWSSVTTMQSVSVEDMLREVLSNLVAQVLAQGPLFKVLPKHGEAASL